MQDREMTEERLGGRGSLAWIAKWSRLSEPPLRGHNKAMIGCLARFLITIRNIRRPSSFCPASPPPSAIVQPGPSLPPAPSPFLSTPVVPSLVPSPHLPRSLIKGSNYATSSSLILQAFSPDFVFPFHYFPPIVRRWNETGHTFA